MNFVMSKVKVAASSVSSFCFSPSDSINEAAVAPPAVLPRVGDVRRRDKPGAVSLPLFVPAAAVVALEVTLCVASVVLARLVGDVGAPAVDITMEAAVLTDRAAGDGGFGRSAHSAAKVAAAYRYNQYGIHFIINIFIW